MRIYISGPMRGYDDHNFPAFNAAAEYIRKLGHSPLNPANNPAGLTLEAYMDLDLALVRASDALLLLEGWETSKGAAVEVAYAKYLSREIYVRLSDIPGIAQGMVATVPEAEHLRRVACIAQGILAHGDLHWHTPQADRQMREEALRKALDVAGFPC